MKAISHLLPLLLLVVLSSGECTVSLKPGDKGHALVRYGNESILSQVISGTRSYTDRLG